MRKLKPKFVKKAGKWVVTTFEKDKQGQQWFSEEEEAWKFAREK